MAAGRYDLAFNNFTKVLNGDDGVVDAMEKRALIHFQRNEFEFCAIEREEIQRLRPSEENLKLLKAAKQNIQDKMWFEVLGLSPQATMQEVTVAYRALAKIFSPNASKNVKINITDRIKYGKTMASINAARAQFKQIKKENN